MKSVQHNIKQVVTQLAQAHRLSAEHLKQRPGEGQSYMPVCNPETEDAMISLWERMGELFGAKWIRQWGTVDDPAFNTWCQYLSDLQPDQIRQGFINLLRDKPKFLPDAEEFHGYCTSMSGMGIPVLEKAYEEACLAPSPKIQHAWSHPIVYHAGVMTGWSDLHALTREEGLKRFAYNYEILKRRLAAGEDLAIEIPKAIPEKISPVLEPEKAMQAMQDLRATVGI